MTARPSLEYEREWDVPDDPAQAREYFAWRARELIGDNRAHWAEKHGLSYGAVRDLVQGRVLPSRAMVVLLLAIECEPEFMASVARLAKDELALLDAARGKASTT